MIKPLKITFTAIILLVLDLGLTFFLYITIMILLVKEINF